MTRHRQSLDPSATSLLITCTCGWREFAFTEDAAWRQGVEHADVVHGDRKQAQDVISARARRARGRVA